MTNEKLTVEVMGRRLEIGVEGLTPIEASALAEAVSERMREIQKQTGIADSGKLAVMTALYLTHELQTLQNQHDETVSEMTQRLRAMTKVLEESLNITEESPVLS